MTAVGRTTSPLTYAQAEALVLASEAKAGNPRLTEPLTLHGFPRPDYAWCKAFGIYGVGDDPEQPPAANQPAFIQFPVEGFEPEWAMRDLLVGNPNLKYEIVGSYTPAWQQLEALPGLVAAWDPARGVAFGASPSVSDWQDIVNGRVLSQTIGSQQPVFLDEGACPSGAPSLDFSRAASQVLTGEHPDFGSWFSSDTFCLYAALRVHGATGAHAVASVSGVGQASRTWLLANPQSNHVTCVRASETDSNTINSLAFDRERDVWAYADVRASDDCAVNHRDSGADEIHTSYNLARPGITQARFTVGAGDVGGVLSNHLDGEVYAVLAFDTSADAVDHAAVQAALAQLMNYAEGVQS